ncbi:hypothetical protein [Sorangium cellulosum]|uniref:hypothetical protein n=1 Tax=Sorangium cellulosum TaxID=56 RepID=UPI0012FF77B3|nr:hypothetical protein [Sorangium cellulosum]
MEKDVHLPIVVVIEHRPELGLKKGRVGRSIRIGNEQPILEEGELQRREKGRRGGRPEVAPPPTR